MRKLIKRMVYNISDGLETLFFTLRSADWRMFIVAPALLLMLNGILPMIQPGIFESGRLQDFRNLFRNPAVMMFVYAGIGFSLLINLRTRRLVALLPLAILAFGFYCVTQVVYGGLYYVVSTSILGISGLVYAFIVGGGFIINSDIDTKTRLTFKEKSLLFDAEKVERIVKMSPEGDGKSADNPINLRK